MSDYPALKTKKRTYFPCESFYAGDSSHGTIHGTPTYLKNSPNLIRVSFKKPKSFHYQVDFEKVLMLESYKTSAQKKI